MPYNDKGRVVGHAAITPHDTNEINYDAIYVGTTGNLTCKLAQSGKEDDYVTYVNLQAGVIYPICVKVVHTDTTASNLVGLKIQ